VKKLSKAVNTVVENLIRNTLQFAVEEKEFIRSKISRQIMNTVVENLMSADFHFSIDEETGELLAVIEKIDSAIIIKGKIIRK
jgi:hypothetical protein